MASAVYLADAKSLFSRKSLELPGRAHICALVSGSSAVGREANCPEQRAPRIEVHGSGSVQANQSLHPSVAGTLAPDEMIKHWRIQ